MQILMFIILLILIFLFVRYSYKKCNGVVEKIVCIILVITYFTPILIYYLDLWNIPSALNLVNNINSQNWLAFLSNYTSSIVSTMIGVTASIFLALYQIKKNNEENIKREAENKKYNLKRDKENIRLQNMPILKYKLNTCEPVSSEDLIVTKFNSNKTYRLTIALKNIGLNNIKNIKINFESDILKTYRTRLLGKDTVVVMEKGEEIKIKKYFALDISNKPYQIIIIIFYQDVLSNWYKQILNINYMPTNRVELGGYIGDVQYIVEEEKMLINEEEIDQIYDVKGE